MEVVQASGPGTRVRLMRAAWHASSGPGTGSSYMLHSSRRVISSGSNHLMSPTLVSKPLEISSTPLDISPEGCSEAASYKVTEPDDHDISEPSKWRGSTRGSSIRMPSEESSSTDNASIIDLDPKLNSLHSTRKLSLDSDNSDICTSKKRISSASPILDAPVSLSTLKFKTLLNNTTENWHDRRKSYSFENTSLSERELSKHETAMESSTDSGIHKSSEIVNENLEEDRYQKHPEYRTSHTPREETFKDWLARNRPKQIFKGVELKPHREDKSPDRINIPIAVQSKGKVSITLSNVNDTQDDSCHLRGYSSDDTDRKLKRVEFCKTELHFAAESGKVNIIATDEKPAPTNDFRRKKSAFVPMQGNFEKPVTLFGEKYDSFTPIDAPSTMKVSVDNNVQNETDDYQTSCIEENIGVTKSILKNKIPKPKPYFLGEDLIKKKDHWPEEKKLHTFNAAKLVNEQLQVQQGLNSKKLDDLTTDSISNNNYIDNDNHFSKRIVKKSPPPNDIATDNNVYNSPAEYDSVDVDSKTIKQKLKVLQVSPVMQPKAKTRQLRDNELTYFGINDTKQKITSFHNKKSSDIEFNSVRLIQKAASDLSDNGSVRSCDTPEYQNLPINSNYAPIPKPRSHRRDDVTSRHQEKIFSSLESDFQKELENIHESEFENTLTSSRAKFARETSRRRIKNNDLEKNVTKSRSISEPPKFRSDLIKELKYTQHKQLESLKRQRVSRTPSMEKCDNSNSQDKAAKSRAIYKGVKADSPIYENVDIGKKDQFSEKQHKSSSLAVDNNRQDKIHTQAIKQNAAHQEKTKPENRNKPANKVHHTNSIVKAAKNKNDKTERNGENEVSSTVSTPISMANKSKSVKKSLNKSRETECSRNKNQKPVTDTISKRSSASTDRDQPIDNHCTKSRSRDRTTRKKELDARNEHGTERNIKTPVTGEDTLTNRSCTKRSKSKENSDAKHRNKNDETTLKNDTIILESSNVRNSSRVRSKTNETDSRNAKRKSSSNKREYVINYDDKNGTFSSISKIKHGISKNHDDIKTVDSKKVDKESNKGNKTRTKLRIPLRK